MAKFDPRAAVEAAIEQGAVVDQTQVVAGGGDYKPPAEGAVRLRFVGYYEIGKHTKTYKGTESQVDKVQLVFELHGKNHPPREFDGKKEPLRITETLTLSQSEKATFTKIFKAMNYAGKATHMAQLLGEAYIGTVYHDKWIGKDGKERVTASLRNDVGYSIAKPFRVNEEDEEVRVPVPEALSEIKAFLWNFPSLDMWNSIYIDGEYSEGRSRNTIQNKIMEATNWVGSPMYTILQNGGEMPDLPDAERPATSKEADLDNLDEDIPF